MLAHLKTLATFAVFFGIAAVILELCERFPFLMHWFIAAPAAAVIYCCVWAAYAKDTKSKD
jgi:hypothetical protein